MNRSELVAVMAEQAGISKKDADKALAAFISTVESTVAAGNSMQLVGFGTFSKATQSARTAFGKKVPAKSVPKFKAGKAFKDIVTK